MRKISPESSRPRTKLTAPRTVSLGKLGSFPSNLIIHRPYHLTYEIQDKREDENFSRLRLVPAAEIHSDILADTKLRPDEGGVEVEDDANVEGDGVISAGEGLEFRLVDAASGQVVARSNREVIDEPARQTLSMEEIEELKRDGGAGGKNIIAKLILSHTGLDKKTSYSLAKYKLLKVKKYLRRFTVLPLDPHTLGQYMMDEKDRDKILELRQETLGLLSCWTNVHFGGADIFDHHIHDPLEGGKLIQPAQTETGGRWLVIDETGGLLVAAMAERMGILYRTTENGGIRHEGDGTRRAAANGEHPSASEPNDVQMQTEEAKEGREAEGMGADVEIGEDLKTTSQANPDAAKPLPHQQRRDDFQVPYSLRNTLTVIHSHSQPNLVLLRHYDFDVTNPNPPFPLHPLSTHLLALSWLQLLEPESDPIYSTLPPQVPDEVLQSWKSSRRGHYHRKRRRWTKTRYVVDSTRAGGFSGLAVASTMDVVSILRRTLPLLAGGVPVVVYSPTVEPLTHLADCFSIARRTAWLATPPPEAIDKTAEELEDWAPTEDFPVNPTLLIGSTVQTIRAKRWQVLPDRTHPLMSGSGGAEGYVYTAWRAIPADGKVAARGKFKRRKVDASG